MKVHYPSVLAYLFYWGAVGGIMKKQKPKELLERLPFPNYIARSSFYSILSDEEQKQNDIKVQEHNYKVLGEIMELAIKKMSTLLDYYDINQDNENKWFELAMKLAMAHEPGFQMQESPSGRINTWDSNQLLGFYCLIELIKEKKGISTTHACQIAKKDHFPDSAISIKTLANKYSLVKKDKIAMALYDLALQLDIKKNSNDARLKTLQEMFDASII